MTAIHFERGPKFIRELEKLLKKFRSLNEDLSRLEKVITADPLGSSQHRDVIHKNEHLTIIKARLSCQYLRNQSLRVIYAYHQNTYKAIWIELYHKSEKANEDRERWLEYVKQSGFLLDSDTSE